LTIPKDIKAYLQYPLYKLYYIDSLINFSGLSNKEITDIRKEYSSDIIHGIIDAIKWVEKQENIDLTKLIVGPNHSNSDIRNYLLQVKNDLLSVVASVPPEK
jgi:hypothetical protein